MRSNGDWPARLIHEAPLTRERLRTVAEHTHPSYLWHGHWHQRYRDQLQLDDSHTVKVEGLAHDAAPWHENLVLANTTGAIPWPLRT